MYELFLGFEFRVHAIIINISEAHLTTAIMYAYQDECTWMILSMFMGMIGIKQQQSLLCHEIY